MRVEMWRLSFKYVSVMDEVMMDFVSSFRPL